MMDPHTIGALADQRRADLLAEAEGRRAADPARRARPAPGRLRILLTVRPTVPWSGPRDHPGSPAVNVPTDGYGRAAAPIENRDKPAPQLGATGITNDTGSTGADERGAIRR